jgi:hypothetical protein
MNCYEYTVLLGDIVMRMGTLQASTEGMAETRLEREILPKEQYSAYCIQQLFCQDCGGNNDVVAFYDRKERKVQCIACRHIGRRL